MKSFSQIMEATGMVVFTFGRFNPPTTGHEKLIQKVASIAGSNPFRIYPSQSQNQKNLQGKVKNIFYVQLFR